MAGRRREEGGRGEYSPRPPSSTTEQRVPRVRSLLVRMLLGAFSGGVLGALSWGGFRPGFRVSIWTGGLVPVWLTPLAMVSACVLVLLAYPFFARRRGKGWLGVLALLLPAAYAFPLVYCAGAVLPVPALFLLGGLVVLDVMAVALAPVIGRPYGGVVRNFVLAGSAMVVLVLVSIPILFLPFFAVP